jgi:hypothetical protein
MSIRNKVPYWGKIRKNIYSSNLCRGTEEASWLYIRAKSRDHFDIMAERRVPMQQ